MKHLLETRTKSAQVAVRRARERVLQNETMIEKLHRDYGLEVEESSFEESSNLELFKEREVYWKQFNEEDYKINTSSKLKQYFQDIIKSIH
mgnify:FL=1|jgi:hypothetical protein